MRTADGKYITSRSLGADCAYSLHSGFGGALGEAAIFALIVGLN
jgi:hypothetical protein